MEKETKQEIAKMKLLMERMEKRYTPREVSILSEEISEADARDRNDVDTSEFFDLVSSMKGGSKATIGYMSAAKLVLPQVKRKNPETNRMKSYDDWEAFGKALGVEGEVAGVLKFACYNLNWRSPINMNKHYNKNYVDKVNQIRSEYGIEPMGHKKAYADTMNFGSGVSVYSGDNADKIGHSYSPQDIGNAIKDVKYYLIGVDGKIIREVSIDELKPYFKQPTIDGIRAMKAINMGDDEIAEYAKKVAALNFRYTQFEHSSVVFVITSINGEKKRFFNKNLRDNVNGLKIDTNEVLNLAKQKYQIADAQIKQEDIGEFADEYANYSVPED